MRADDDVHLPGGELLDDPARLFRASEARQLGDPHRPVGKAIGKGLQVLLGEERRRAKDGDLLAVGDGDERGPQCDLGLAEADVAADQPVHRLAGGHVGDHRLDRRRLVWRRLVAEALGEGLEVALLDAEGVAVARGAPRVQGEQLGGGVAHLLRGARLGLVPFVASKLVQRRLLGLRAAVAADHAELRNGHIELVAALVLQEKEFALAVLQLEIEQSLVAADAVLLVHHRVADLQLRQVAQHPLDRAARLAFARAVADQARVELGLGDDRPAFRGHHEAACQGRHSKHKRPVARLEFLEVPAQAGLQAVLGKVACHRLAPPWRLRGYHHAQIRCVEEALERGKRILRAAVHGDAWRRQRDQAVVLVLLLAVKIDARVLAQPQVEFFRRHEELRRRQQRPVGVAALQLQPRARLAPEVLDRARHVVVQRDAAALRKVVEQRRSRFEEQRQVVLDAGGRHAVGNVPVQGFLRRIAFEQLAPAAAEARAACLVERKLARRQQPDFLHRVERALRVDVERLDRLDELVIQVEAVGQRAARRKQIDQPAAEAEFSRRYDLGDVLVAGDDKLSLQGI